MANDPSSPSRYVPEVWELHNDVMSILFATEAAAKTHRSEFPPSVSGGMEITKRFVLGEHASEMGRDTIIEECAKAAGAMFVHLYAEDSADYSMLEVGRKVSQAIQALKGKP